MEATGRDVGVIVVAAGRSSRLGGPVPKVWLPWRGAPLLAASLRTVARLEAVAAVVLVVRDEDAARAEQLVASLAGAPGRVVRVASGGAERSDSVRSGLAALAALEPPPRWVVVHDAARPNASLALFEAVLRAAREHGAAVAAVPVVDTLRRRGADGRTATVDRAGLHAVQTPQAFRRDLLVRAHERAGAAAAATDDALLVEQLGEPVALVPGEPGNVKITAPGDLEHAARLAPDAEGEGMRIGLGHDLHRLAPGGPLRLGGVDLPADVHAVGHSDGDALLHAVTDAVLGACALGDIGQHFSDGDPAQRGRDSAHFLRHALELAAARGFALRQLDAVVHLERPRLAPHRVQLVARLAELLDLPADAVSVKAKTAEGLGPVGAGEAIACDALVQLGRAPRSA